ncbi:MAG TPA: hypothetical protein VFP67_13995 [Acidimicrobiia bacterium]|nr:hypothetical protein [Acidimicrobiia bacterium]
MRVGPLPDDFQFARDQLHQLAFFALAPARYASEERMGLRSTPGGFGTPEYDGKVSRVEGSLLVQETGGEVATQAITTIRAAAEFFGVAYDVDWFTGFKDPLPAMEPDRPLRVEDEPARALADWFAFGSRLLERLRGEGNAADEVSEVQLWPEHFDPAIEMGSEAEGRRASYGASPGDRGHLEPYLYVSAWGEIDRDDPFWNDRHFNGASLPYVTLLEAEDQERVALEFFTEGYRILNG